MMLDASDGRYTVVVARVVYMKRTRVSRAWVSASEGTFTR